MNRSIVSPPQLAARLWPFGLAAVVLAFAVWQTWWLCDDAFISFRYSLHLADGIGLRYNPADTPIEGYSNFLWRLYLAGIDWLGGVIPRVATWTSAATALALLWFVVASLARATAGRSGAVALASLVLVTLPPFAVWSTGGLATMPTVCAVFAAWACLMGGARTRWRLAALASVLGVLLRADAILFLGLVHAGAFAAGQLGRDPALRLGALKSGLVTLGTFAAQTLFRALYHGDWIPNTARVKGGVSAMTLERGLNYDVEFLLSFVAVPLALLVSLALPGTAPRRQRLTAWSLVVGALAYCVYIGGDWMSMGRMLVVALPFVAYLLGSSFAGLLHRGTPLGIGSALLVAAACITTSILAGTGHYVVPESVRSHFHYRWNSEVYLGPYEHWRVSVGDTRRWSKLGRVLKRRTQPGESLVIGTIGAIGYYSDLHIHDTFGLVNRMGAELGVRRKRRSPGHDRRIPLESFLPLGPTYVGAELVPPGQPDYNLLAPLRPGYEHAESIEIVFHPLENDARQLRLALWKPGRDPEARRADPKGRWHKVRAPATPAAPPDEQRRLLDALGYAGGTVPAPATSNVTVSVPDEVFAGLNFYTSGHACEALLVDMEGRTLHRWRKGFREVWPDAPQRPQDTGSQHWRRALLFENGDLLAIHEGRGIFKIDKDSELIWENYNRAHHDLELRPNGDIYVLTRRKRLAPELHPERKISEDFVTVLDAQGETLRSVSVIEAFQASDPTRRLWREYTAYWKQHFISDVLHTNTLEVIGRDRTDVHPAFRQGNVLISCLNMSAIAVLNLQEEKIEWVMTGVFRAQHDPTLLDNGHLMLFDNRGRRGRSAVLEYDLSDQSVAWEFRGSAEQPFYSDTCGTAQRLPNGNTLVTESDNGRAFELTADKRIVWEFYNPHRAGENDEFIATLFELRRLPPDFPVDWADGR